MHASLGGAPTFFRLFPWLSHQLRNLPPHQFLGILQTKASGWPTPTVAAADLRCSQHGVAGQVYFFRLQLLASCWPRYVTANLCCY